MDLEHDKWSRWILERRFGSDPATADRFARELALVRDTILDNAAVSAGETLLDAGCGDGLIGFGALERTQPDGEVIFSDISAPLLGVVRERARANGTQARCRFVEAPVERLTPVADGSVDAVTMRSVLIYVPHKLAAFRECLRVLRRGGRLSLGEPVNRPDELDAEASDDRFLGCDVAPVADLVAKFRAAHGERDLDADPMTDFTERDLMRLAREAGFADTHLTLQIDVRRRAPQSWESLVSVSPNPNAPSLAESFASVLDMEENARLERYLRPLIEAGAGVGRRAFAFVWAIKA